MKALKYVVKLVIARCHVRKRKVGTQIAMTLLVVPWRSPEQRCQQLLLAFSQSFRGKIDQTSEVVSVDRQLSAQLGPFPSDAGKGRLFVGSIKLFQCRNRDREPTATITLHVHRSVGIVKKKRFVTIPFSLLQTQRADVFGNPIADAHLVVPSDPPACKLHVVSEVFQSSHWDRDNSASSEMIRATSASCMEVSIRHLRQI